jgi:hypothetical protein
MPQPKLPTKALIVFTDGIENMGALHPQRAGRHQSADFRLGLGDLHQASSDALKTLSSRAKGYTLLASLLSANLDDYFLRRRYFLQTVAGGNQQGDCERSRGLHHGGRSGAGTVRVERD